MVGCLPWVVEAHWRIWGSKKPFNDHYLLTPIAQALVDSAASAAEASMKTSGGKRVLIFATLHYWIRHTALTGLALAGCGHDVTLAYLPYSNWRSPVSRLLLRRRILHTDAVMRSTENVLKTVCWLRRPRGFRLPEQVQKAVQDVSLMDAQYTLQAEHIDPSNPVYRLRLKRNHDVAAAALAYLSRHRPDVVIVPNGVILEFGMVYAVARYLGIRTVTYEFGEQSNRIWLAQNAQIIRHETDDLWVARKREPLTDEQRVWLNTFFFARQATQRGDSFARLWQETGRQGGARVRRELGLDDRPVVLFTTNVLGDSLTLGRQLLGSTMSEWITLLVKYFASRHDVQLVVRIHPGENLTKGPSVTGVIRAALPELPEHIHLIGPKDKVNTYDLMEVSSLGLVYTTTSGLEMAARGLPVMTAGKTHYRGRGFTIDTDSYQEFFTTLDRVLSDLPAYHLKPEQIALAWNYAYRFFREFPRPFPWHILHLAADYHGKPMHHVLSPEGKQQYDSTFRFLVGEPLDWKAIGE